MDKRLRRLHDWTRHTLGKNRIRIDVASADASFRRYFRVTDDDRGSWIVMDAPPGQENTAPFVRTARRFLELGLHVPQILAENAAEGFLLLTDLGDRTYLSALNPDTADTLYGDAIEALVTLQSASRRDPKFFPAYGETLLRGEMELFRQWYVPRHLGSRLTVAENEVVDRCFALLTRQALDQPRVWVHRDYHSRNLMVTETGNPGILDFQDAVLGPLTYDLVSLLKDCYIRWPEDDVERWIEAYRAAAGDRGTEIGDAAQFRQWFHYMGAQRHIKVLGIFSRLCYRDGKKHYLDDIPLVRDYLTDACARLPGLEEFATVLDAVEARAA